MLAARAQLKDGIARLGKLHETIAMLHLDTMMKTEQIHEDTQRLDERVIKAEAKVNKQTKRVERMLAIGEAMLGLENCAALQALNLAGKSSSSLCKL